MPLIFNLHATHLRPPITPIFSRSSRLYAQGQSECHPTTPQLPPVEIIAHVRQAMSVGIAPSCGHELDALVTQVARHQAAAADRSGWRSLLAPASAECRQFTSMGQHDDLVAFLEP
jgi:hypothetical protein